MGASRVASGAPGALGRRMFYGGLLRYNYYVARSLRSQRFLLAGRRRGTYDLGIPEFTVFV